MKQRLLIWLCGLTLLTTVHAQTLQVSLPIDGAIYQQNTQNQGKLVIRGDFNSKSFLFGGVYIISASLQKLNLTTGSPLPDAPIRFPLSQRRTTFSGERMIAKGWYELTVRADLVAGYPFNRRTYETKRKIGIGEVFIIAGQSNAQGGFGYIAPNTQLLDAVRVSPDLIPQDFRNRPTDLPSSYRTIQNLRSTTNTSVIGPLGPDLWYWGSVAAKIALDCDAPVAMFNAAFGGTTITNWATSTNPNAKSSGQTESSDPTAGRYGPGAPFYFFGNMFKLYASTYGVRAVLWMQGETDTKAISNVQTGTPQERNSWADRELLNRDNRPIPAPLGSGNFEKRWVRNDEEYRQKLKAVIDASRGQIGNRSVPWVIARTSYITEQTSSVVIAGQDVSRISLSDIYQGPSTDDLGTAFRRPRGSGSDEPVHFNQNGLEVVANRWTDVLKSVCRNTTPITFQDLGTDPQGVEISDDGLTASAPAGFSGYSWTYDNGSSANADRPVGNDRSIVTDGSAANTAPVSGAQAQVVFAGTYRAFLKNSQGNDVLTQTVTLPYTIVDDTGGSSCDFSGGPRQVGSWSGLTVQIRSISGKNVLVAAVPGSATDLYFPRGDNFWDEFTKDAGVENLRGCLNAGNTDYGGRACPTVISPPPGYRQGSTSDRSIYYEMGTGCTAPAAPTVNANGSTEVCGGSTVTLTASGCAGSISWSNGQNGSQIQVGAGTYSANCSQNGCSSGYSNSITVTNCGTPPPTGGGGCTPLGETCSGNEQEKRTVTINSTATGNFPLVITYRSHEKAVDGVVQVNGVSQTVRFNQTGVYTTVTTAPVPLNQGSNNTVVFNTQAGGGYLCFNQICVGSGGGTPPPPPSGGSCAGSINTINYNWDGGNNSISFTVNSSAGNPQIKLSGPTNADWMGTYDFGNANWYQAVTGVATGDYTVSVRPSGDGGAGCSFNFSVPSTGHRLYPAGGRLGVSSLQEESQSGKWQLAPNPAKDWVSLRTPYSVANRHLRVVITAVNGREVYQSRIEESASDPGLLRVSLQEARLIRGVYLIRVLEGDRLLTVQRFVKE